MFSKITVTNNKAARAIAGANAFTLRLYLEVINLSPQTPMQSISVPTGRGWIRYIQFENRI